MSVRDSGVTCALDKSDLQMLDDLRLTKIIKPDHYFTKFYSVNNWPFLQETKQVLFKKRTLLKLDLGTSQAHRYLLKIMKGLNQRLFTIETIKTFNEANFPKDVRNYYFSLRTDDPSESYVF